MQLEVAKEENLAYSKEIQNLQLEREQLKAEIRDLEQKVPLSAVVVQFSDPYIL